VSTTDTAVDATARARDLLGVSRLTNQALTTWLHGLPGVDQVGCEARAAGLGTRSIKNDSKRWAIDLAISMIDLTTLEGADTHGRVRGLAAKALSPDPSDLTTPRPAAVCVYGDMVATAKEVLGDSGVKVAAVATAFPSGRASMPVKLLDTKDAVTAGADEIDMVIDRGAFLSGDYLTVFHQIAQTKAACGDARLKVIMETGELVTYDNVRRASWLSMLAGGDFIKTSTGKIQPAATLPSRSSCSKRCATGVNSPVRWSASSLPVASRPARTRSSSSSRSTRSPVRTGSTTSGSASAPPLS
jgi:deoxyribose-phosphate aldolase